MTELSRVLSLLLLLSLSLSFFLSTRFSSFFFFSFPCSDWKLYVILDHEEAVLLLVLIQSLTVNQLLYHCLSVHIKCHVSIIVRWVCASHFSFCFTNYFTFVFQPIFPLLVLKNTFFIPFPPSLPSSHFPSLYPGERGTCLFYMLHLFTRPVVPFIKRGRLRFCHKWLFCFRGSHTFFSPHYCSLYREFCATVNNVVLYSIWNIPWLAHLFIILFCFEKLMNWLSLYSAPCFYFLKKKNSTRKPSWSRHSSLLRCCYGNQLGVTLKKGENRAIKHGYPLHAYGH